MAQGKVWIKKLANEFEQHPTPSAANELYETALLYGLTTDISNSAIGLALQHRKKIAPLNIAPRQHIAAPASTTLDKNALIATNDSQQEINRLRKILYINPNLPLSWSELARHFLTLGEQKKAIRCMYAAIKLAKHNRYVCRVASRLFINVKDHDQALHLLRSNPYFKKDPWLLAAEIATSTSAGKQSQYISNAKQIILLNDFTNYQVSELAAAIGTVELSHGSSKQAKIMFDKSLIAPTDNSLAQAQWAIGQDAKISIPSIAWQTPSSFEANTLLARQEQNWEVALNSCIKWLADEPFSLRPAQMGSYIAFLPEHNKISEEFATAGLRRDKLNITLLNNRAVALTYQGKLNEALTDFKTAMNSDGANNSPHLLATLGLIAFGSGFAEIGRECYEKAMYWFIGRKDGLSTKEAILTLLRQEIRHNPSSIPASIIIIERILKTLILTKQPEICGLANLVLKEALAGAILIPQTYVPSISSQELNHFISLFNNPKNLYSPLTILNYSKFI